MGISQKQGCVTLFTGAKVSNEKLDDGHSTEYKLMPATLPLDRLQYVFTLYDTVTLTFDLST